MKSPFIRSLATLILAVTSWCSPAATFNVTTTADAGDGSLRWAISEANLNPGLDTITFTLPGPDYTIVLASLLPHIIEPIVIDGYSGAGTPNSLPNGNNAVLSVVLTTSNAISVPFGLQITGGGSTVQGLVLNGFSTCVLLAQKGGNIVAGNFFGVNPDGVTPAPRLTGTGVYVDTTNSNNLIGGPTPAARNLLSAMSTGVEIRGAGPTFASTTAVEGNFIGTDRHGTNALGNAVAGVTISSRGHRVGGFSAAERNLISGNHVGVDLSGPFNAVIGNFIGTDVTGTRSVSNKFGLNLGSGTNQVGAVTSAPGVPPGNVISGNDDSGIQASGSGHVIAGNLIGVDATGTNRLSNRIRGLRAESERMTIGGAAPGAGNVIAGNDGDGIYTPGSGGRSNVIAGNWIGTDTTGTLNLGNAGCGIRISSARSDSIGNNVIAFNGESGIALVSAAATNHLISANAIYANAGRGIDLSVGNVLDGVTANDPCDADTGGANRLQNFPVLTNVLAGPASTTLGGYMPGEANRSYRLEFFANDACDPGGHGEGQMYLGFLIIPATANCTNGFSVTLPVGALAGKFLTATATDEHNNTSEFSACYATLIVPPSITVQPRSRTNLTGTTALFYVGAGGDAPLAYQWRKDGANLALETNAMLNLVGIQPASAGGYSVVVTNNHGSRTSIVAQLTVNTDISTNHQALYPVSLQSGYGGYIFGEVGFAFRPAAHLTITNLGYAFHSVPAAYTVLIRNAAGTILASATLAASNMPASAFVYSNISPVNVTAGTTNFIACYDADTFAANGTILWLGPVLDGTAPDGGQFDVAPELDYLGPTINGNLISFSGAPWVLYLGPNFQFAASTPVQPSRLEIVRTALNTVLLTWPATDTLGQLQAAPVLGAVMTNVPTPPMVVGTNNVVELPTPEAQIFFRLHYP